jgi:hypothetical protein
MDIARNGGGLLVIGGSVLVAVTIVIGSVLVGLGVSGMAGAGVGVGVLPLARDSE